MKKLLGLLIGIIIPLNIFAYSEYVIPGGDNIGIRINSEGLIVVGFYKVNNKYINKDELHIGDYILEIENNKVLTSKELSKLIEDNIKDGKVNVKIRRDNNIINTKLELHKEDNVYKTGLYVKDKVNGIGTLTYIDPESNIYGALGHEIAIRETNRGVNINDGNIYDSKLYSIDRSTDGSVGSKNANIDFDSSIGTINRNSKYGIYGEYNKIYNKDKMKVANYEDIKLGKAYILTNVNGEINKYLIEITNISKNKNSNKSLSFTVKDPKLLEITGGIVQGMSGSPIIQDDKIIGAVTFVVVNDVERGYGIFIRTMLEENDTEKRTNN